MLHNLWPTPLLEQSLDTSRWLSAVKDLLPDDSVIRSHTSIRPWSTDDLLHLEPAFASLVDLILASAGQLADQQGILRDSLYVTSMWANAQYQGQNHASHTHPNSLYSGCIYLQVPDGSQNIMFIDPRPGAGVLQPRGVSANIGIRPSNGLWLMWPSWLMHSTVSVSDQELVEPRITISYNVMLKDNITTHSSRLNLQ